MEVNSGEKCSDCGREMGRREIPRIFGGEIVCPDCEGYLMKGKIRPPELSPRISTQFNYKLFFGIGAFFVIVTAIASTFFIWFPKPIGINYYQTSPYKTIDEAIKAIPPLPKEVSGNATELARQAFGEDYKKWTLDCSTWGEGCRGIPVDCDVTLSDAYLLPGGKNIDLDFSLSNSNVIKFSYKADGSQLSYWATFKIGDRFHISGKVAYAFVLGPLGVPDKDWHLRTEYEDGDTTAIYFSLSTPVTTPLK